MITDKNIFNLGKTIVMVTLIFIIATVVAFWFILGDMHIIPTDKHESEIVIALSNVIDIGISMIVIGIYMRANDFFNKEM